MTVGDGAALAARASHSTIYYASLVHARARPRARHGDAGARARRAERGRLSRTSASRPRARRCSARSAARSASPIFGAIFANSLRSEARGAAAAGRARPEDRRTRRPCARCRRPCTTRTCTRSRRRFIRCSSSPRSIAVVAFVLTWLLREVPLRTTSRATAGSELEGASSEETAVARDVRPARLRGCSSSTIALRGGSGSSGTTRTCEGVWLVGVARRRARRSTTTRSSRRRSASAGWTAASSRSTKSG